MWADAESNSANPELQQVIFLVSYLNCVFYEIEVIVILLLYTSTIGIWVNILNINIKYSKSVINIQYWAFHDEQDYISVLAYQIKMTI